MAARVDATRMVIVASATRMQLLRTRRRLAIARRGHKLLKDKRDELMRRFLEVTKRSKELREEVEKELIRAERAFLVVRSSMPPWALGLVTMPRGRERNLMVSYESVMNVRVPRFSVAGGEDTQDPYAYSFATTSGELDQAISALMRVFPRMVELAALEKSVMLLADEIEKTRRRVNALEYVLIPQLEETVRYITMKLDEMERSNLTRLMKIKEIVHERDLPRQGSGAP